MQFTDVVGHTTEKKQLVKAVNNQRISHAQYFLSLPGCGNLAMALAFVQYIFCENRTNEDSCNTCSACIKLNKLTHPDLKLIFPIFKGEAGKKEADLDKYLPKFREVVLKNAYVSETEWYNAVSDSNKNPIISINEARFIIKNLAYQPFEAAYQIYLVWLPERLRKDAANLLLKALEEPPKNVIFLLVGNDFDRLLPTVRSRLQLVKLKKINDFDMVEALTQLTDLPIQKVQSVVNIADGNFNIAKHLLNEKGLENENLELFRRWMNICYTANMQSIIELSDLLHGFGRDKQKQFIEYGLFILREAIAAIHNPELLRATDSEKTFLTKIAPFLENHQLISNMADSMQFGIDAIARNAHAKSLFTSLSLKFSKYFYDARRAKQKVM